MNKLTRHHATREHGFTLIEVLITLVIMAVGMLGLAGMQITSLKNTESAYQRSQAAQMAYDMLDRMRANTQGVTENEYNAIDDTPPGSYTDCEAATCTAAQMAEFDDATWHAALATLLPSGTGEVDGNGADSIFTITITWDDTRDGNANTSFELSSRI